MTSRYGLMVERFLAKEGVGVRFPLPAPEERTPIYVGVFSLLRYNYFISLNIFDMSKYDTLPYIAREGTADSKPLGSVEVGGQQAEYYVPASGVPDLYIEGISEPVIKVEIDFVPGEGWKVTDLAENENPAFQEVLGQITGSGQYQNYTEEVASYIRHLNIQKPNGV